MSLPFIGVTVGSTLVLSYFIGKYMTNQYVYGNDGKGGDLISVKTRFNEEDMQYNREF